MVFYLLHLPQVLHCLAHLHSVGLPQGDLLRNQLVLSLLGLRLQHHLLIVLDRGQVAP